MERTNAWLGQFPRLLVRHEHLLSADKAFFYILRRDYAEALLMKHALLTNADLNCDAGPEVEIEEAGSWAGACVGFRVDDVQRSVLG